MQKRSAEPIASSGLFIALLLLSACAAQRPPIKATPCTLAATLRLEASDRLNPDGDGEPLPTVVRLYQLNAVERLEQADFAQIWQEPTLALGEDLVRARELTMYPGQAELLEVSLAPSVRYLVAVAIYRMPTGNQWRSIIPLPDSAAMCGAYEVRGAPDPAVVYQFDQYRVEGRTRLLRGAANDHDLPGDVAPDVQAKGKTRP